jgi:hypothetical protein
MKKLIALLAVCGFAATFIACGGKKEEAATTDSVATEAPVAAPATTDSAATDSAAVAPVDSAAHH